MEKRAFRATERARSMPAGEAAAARAARAEAARGGRESRRGPMPARPVTLQRRTSVAGAPQAGEARTAGAPRARDARTAGPPRAGEGLASPRRPPQVGEARTAGAPRAGEGLASPRRLPRSVTSTPPNLRAGASRPRLMAARAASARDASSTRLAIGRGAPNNSFATWSKTFLSHTGCLVLQCCLQYPLWTVKAQERPGRQRTGSTLLTPNCHFAPSSLPDMSQMCGLVPLPGGVQPRPTDAPPRGPASERGVPWPARPRQRAPRVPRSSRWRAPLLSAQPPSASAAPRRNPHQRASPVTPGARQRSRLPLGGFLPRAARRWPPGAGSLRAASREASPGPSSRPGSASSLHVREM